VAAPIEVDDPEMNSPWSPPYTVDTLFELPETGLRFEVLEGQLIVSPAPTPAHSGVLELLLWLFKSRLPEALRFLPGAAVRLPNRDGPIPDLLITSAVDLNEYPKGLPAALVHTVVEVVSPSNAITDRITKTRLYAEAGIPCYWRIEQRPWRGHFGPVPAIVVRLFDKAGEWQQTVAAAGTETELPVVVDADGTIVPVRIDPAALVGKHSA
jgi:Uma2 family endonuclease